MGLGLCLAGAIFAPISYFIIASVPLTSVGISTIIIGLICIALANTRPYISPEACELILKTGMENTAALIEELGLRSRAIYLPSAMREGRAQALIPLVDSKEIKLAKEKIPGRLIVRYGANPEDMAIAVSTPGSLNLDMLGTRTASGPTPADIEAAATYVLTGLLDIASSVNVTMSDSQVNVDIGGPKLHWEDVWFYRCLGSPIASIMAALSCEALGKAVRIKEEDYSQGKSRITIEVLP